LGLMVTAYFISKKNNYVGTYEKPTIKSFLKALNEAKYALLLPVIILGGIFSGFFSPTESAAIAVIYVLIIGIFVHKEINLTKLYETTVSATVTSASIVVVIAFSEPLAYIMQIHRVPETITTFLVGLSSNPIIIL